MLLLLWTPMLTAPWYQLHALDTAAMESAVPLATDASATPRYQLHTPQYQLHALGTAAMECCKAVQQLTWQELDRN
jgi:hypothetical protein